MPKAYITDQLSGKVSVIDTATVVSTITVGSQPAGVAVSPDGNTTYVTNSGSNSVSVIDTASNAVSATISVGAQPWGVAFAPGGSKAYVANTATGANSVSVIDTATTSVITTITVGTNPYGVAVTPDGSMLYVTNAGAGTNSVSVIDTRTNTVVATISVGNGPSGIAIAPNGLTAYSTNASDGTVSVIDTATQTVSATIAVGSQPVGIAVSPDGTTVYVANETSNSVSVIDTATNTVTATITVGTFPIGVAITPDGSTVYVANVGDTVSVIDTATNTVTTVTLPAGSSPIAFGQFIQPPSTHMTTIYTAPQGRLTLTSNTPVMTADATAATSVYYTPYQGNIIPIYDGANMQSYIFGQLTMTLNTSNQLSGKIYDLFLFLNSSVVTIGAGPAWSSTSTRGTGAGTTQLQQIDGLWVNANTITLKNGSTSYSSIPVGEATYVGSVYMTANGQTQWNIKPTAASGGTNNIIGVWNAYNRVSLKSLSRDSSGYTYATATWRSADNSTSNRISLLDGLGQSSVTATLINNIGTATTSAQVYIGINRNSTSATPNLISFAASPTATLASNYNTYTCEEAFPPLLGFTYYQAMENAQSAVTSTFNALGTNQSLTLDCEY